MSQDGGGRRTAGARVIALMNQKGGVGKTTTTVSVGAAMALRGQRVLLIDLDPQSHLSLSLGIEPDRIEKTVYDLMTDEDCSALEVVQTVEGYTKLAVMPSETNLAGLDAELSELSAEGRSQTLLRDKCRDLFTHFDVVLIDCPPALGLLTVNGLAASSEVVIPMQAHFLAMQGMSELLQTVQSMRQHLNDQLRVAGVVICMYEGNTLLASDVINEVREFFEQYRGSDAPWADAIVFQPPIRRNIRLAEAPGHGRSVHTYAPDSNGAADYQALADAILTY